MIFVMDAKISYALLTLVSSPPEVLSKDHTSHYEVELNEEDAGLAPKRRIHIQTPILAVCDLGQVI